MPCVQIGGGSARVQVPADRYLLQLAVDQELILRVEVSLLLSRIDFAPT